MWYEWREYGQPSKLKELPPPGEHYLDVLETILPLRRAHHTHRAAEDFWRWLVRARADGLITEAEYQEAYPLALWCGNCMS